MSRFTSLMSGMGRKKGVADDAVGCGCWPKRSKKVSLKTARLVIDSPGTADLVPVTTVFFLASKCDESNRIGMAVALTFTSHASFLTLDCYFESIGSGT